MDNLLGKNARTKPFKTDILHTGSIEVPMSVGGCFTPLGADDVLDPVCMLR
jgi:hypothetical protein